MSTWKERLDRRISRCTGCDDWCWDDLCKRCDLDQSELAATNLSQTRKMLHQPNGYKSVTTRMKVDPAGLDLGGPTTDRASHQPAADRRRRHIMPYSAGSIDPFTANNTVVSL